MKDAGQPKPEAPSATTSLLVPDGYRSKEALGALKTDLAGGEALGHKMLSRMERASYNWQMYKKMAPTRPKKNYSEGGTPYVEPFCFEQLHPTDLKYLVSCASFIS